MLQVVKSLTPVQKRLILLSVDVLLLPLAFLFTFAVQQTPPSPLGAMKALLPVLPYIMIAAGLLCWMLRIPNVRLNAYEIKAVRRTALFSIYLSLLSAVFLWVSGLPVLLGLHVVLAIVYFLFSAGSRVVMLQALEAIYRRDEVHCRVLIYGAGTTGTQLASAFSAHKTIDPVAFVDDNTALHGLRIAGLPVYSPIRIRELVAAKNINRVLLAIPSLSQPKQMRLARQLEDMGLEVQVLPSFSQLIGEEDLISKLSPVAPNRFLGRETLDNTLRGGERAYAGQNVMISGAGGSIGSELCRQVLACAPKRLVLYELNEYALYNADMELRSQAEENGIEIIPILGSVTDARQVRKVLADHEVQVILHAAAYKHVPLVEYNPLAGLANNVLGTKTLVKEAVAAKVDRFILVSSDKAVRPTNVMGASKRLAEQVVQDQATRSTDTVFAMVRFGNVLGSSGSVVPLFQDQVARGGPVTLTHHDITRYFMTIHEAVRLVLLAGSFAEGGEVFVLDMGEPVKIRDLARQVIESSGYSVRDENNPDGDIEIVTTGLRPGEKLHEELLIAEGNIRTKHPKIMEARERVPSEIEVAGYLRTLREAISSGNNKAVHQLISYAVEGYTPQKDAQIIG